ncbi:MAG: trehalose-6-phosphate synthase [Gammaproteobacteria bacterium]|nr:trehalose-6-phosphate synthase [Gammaproteobacteria bacterium]
MSRLIVVSNRVALPGKDKTAQGGLAVAMMSALEHFGGIWYGWSGELTNSPGKRPQIIKRDKVSFATISLTRKGYKEYYAGYANSSLWPLFHCQLHEFKYDRKWYEGYLKVNRMFARRLLPLLKDDDIIWVHDYHFIPLCESLREAGTNSQIGFFLHIPFPPYDVLRALPDHEEILKQLCQYDLVGFQTELDLENFVECVVAVQDKKTARSKIKKRNTLNVWDKKLRVGAFPIGIDVKEVAKMAETGRKSSQNKRLLSRLVDGRGLIIGVDRLDYSKGLTERLFAFERLLKNYPSNRGKVEYLQVAAPSRIDVPEYAEVRRELNYIAGEINSRFSEYDWIPLHYINKSFSRAVILGFLSVARVGLVTPIKDGMNLVAKEFIASQDPENPGVLILSSMAGAKNELTDALIVNPYDIDAIANSLEAALSMPLKHRVEIWNNMMKVLFKNDVFHWANVFINTLTEPDSHN